MRNYYLMRNDISVKLSFDKKSLVRLKKDVSPNELAPRSRVFINDPITLNDGTEIHINSQVSAADMKGILVIAEKFNYKITEI